MKKLVLITAMLISSMTLAMAQYGTNSYHGGHGNGTGVNHGHNHGPPIMSQFEFRQAKEQIRYASFESEKLTIARQVTRHNVISSHQARGIMRLFSFESTRLKFAKFAYRKVADPTNFYVVNEVFRFSSSVRELDRFIQEQGPVYASGGTYGTNSYYGSNGGANGGSCSSGGGTISVQGHVSSTPVHPTCGMCQAAHHPQHICGKRFAQLMRQMDRLCFDRDKMVLAKQALGNGMLMSANQVRKIMQSFAFERTKLRFAKFAYHHVWNPQRFHVVNQAFAFSSSIYELQAYIDRV